MSEPKIGGISGARPDLTPDQCMCLWIDLMETTDQLLRAGLQASLKPGESLDDVYRAWHREKAKEHDEMIFTMVRRFEDSLSKCTPDRSTDKP